MVAPTSKVRFHVAIPLVVAAMLPALLSVKRVVAVPTGMERKPRREPAGRVVGTVVIAEVVVAVAGSQEEMTGEHRRVDHRRGRIREAALRVDARTEIHRREQDAATGDRVIVIAIDEHVAARRPHVMGRNPVPVGMPRRPVARAPRVAVLLPEPTAGSQIWSAEGAVMLGPTSTVAGGSGRYSTSLALASAQYPEVH